MCLCTDKTGTLTEDRVVLQPRHCNVAGRETRPRCCSIGYLISHFQTGSEEPAGHGDPEQFGLSSAELIEKFKKLDEIPFDFTRRKSVGDRLKIPTATAILLTKGRAGEIFSSAPSSSWTASCRPCTPVDRGTGRRSTQGLSGDGSAFWPWRKKDLDGKKSCSKTTSTI